nr:hypothetical protein [Candidatus Sigynarchaeota archaeon]
MTRSTEIAGDAINRSMATLPVVNQSPAIFVRASFAPRVIRASGMIPSDK